MNTGGWLFLTALFGVLLFLVQRSEPKRRTVSLIIMAVVAYVVWRYALYRMSTECFMPLKTLCDPNLFRQRAEAVATNTTNIAILTALVLNLLYWIVFGRSNPPRSSDVITVLGMKD